MHKAALSTEVCAASGALIAYDWVLTSADCATVLDVAGLSPAAAAQMPLVTKRL